MPIILSTGDLARTFFFQNHTSTLKGQHNTLTQELATGQVADIRSVLAGNVSYISDIERDITALDAYKLTTEEAAQYTSAVQQVLTLVQTAGDDLSSSLVQVGSGLLSPVIGQLASDAKNQLSHVMSALNSAAAGRYLFSGVATDTQPLASQDDLLEGLSTALTGVAGIENIMNAAQDWFDDPDGFAATVYQGSDQSIPPFQTGKHSSASLDVRATDGALRDVLMHMSLSALATDGRLGYDTDLQRELLYRSGEGLLSADHGLTRLRGNTGFVEARIENDTAHNAAMMTSLEFSRNTVFEADPYTTAIDLERVQFQLQSLYTVTARMSQLSLGNFLS